MIDLKDQWCIQIDVTNRCNRACSNCTRFVGHHQYPFYMTGKCFENAVRCLADFPTESPPPTHKVANKVVGMIGGEPLMHPSFEELCAAMEQAIPDRRHRGLWTGLPWERTRHAATVRRVFGYVNNNRHDGKVVHSPILVSVSDAVPDEDRRKKLIEDCWLQQTWSGAVTPRGLFFCEVAAALDLLFDGPGGLPVEPGCWRRPIADFQEQIDRCCNRCGVPLNLKGRVDSENVDDVSRSNLDLLRDSPRVQAGKYVLFDPDAAETTDDPWRYMQ